MAHWNYVGAIICHNFDGKMLASAMKRWADGLDLKHDITVDNDGDPWLPSAIISYKLTGLEENIKSFERMADAAVPN
ncbi:MAG: hypothetical protein NUW01_14340 [Gemmatimonadaceae bacterium]|nr:hypothetical protein [Gemmatimonadaceae bacterium]